MMKSLQNMNKLFLGTVVVPTVIATLYFGLMASDVYISESRFIIRSPQQQNSSPLGFILKGAGFSSSQDDSYTIQDYITSRDALAVLDQKLQLKKAFSQSNIDLFSRFPGLDWDSSFENLYRYYQKMVGVQLDSSSSITTLTTRAFTANDAYQMNQHLLQQSEALVNQLNERARQDMISSSVKEVTEAEKKAQQAALALAKYRNKVGVIDPEKQATIPLEQVAKLQDDLLATKVQIAQLEKLAKDNPQLPSLRQRAQLLEDEINNVNQQVAGSANKSLASKAAEYQRLALEKEFADKMLASAMATLEQARIEAQRKQLYLERIVQPSVPDHAMEPRRIRSIFTVFAVGIIFWGVLSLLISGIKEHQD